MIDRESKRRPVVRSAVCTDNSRSTSVFAWKIGTLYFSSVLGSLRVTEDSNRCQSVAHLVTLTTSRVEGPRILPISAALF